MAYSLAQIIASTRPRRSAQRVFRLQPFDFTPAQERQLLAIMVKLLNEWERAYRQLVVARYSLVTADALVTDNQGDLERGMGESDDLLSRVLLTITPELRDWVVRMDRYHASRFRRVVKTAAGVDLETLVGLAPNQETLAAVLARLVNLVRGLNDDTRKRLEETVWRGFTARTPRTTMAREIRTVLESSRSRALLIARDQTTKLAARLDEERQEEAGIRRYTWRHSRKARPRKEHVARDGQVFEWRKPPYDGHPGYAINCGCKAQAFIDLDTDL